MEIEINWAEREINWAERVITFPAEQEPSKITDKDVDLESKIENERKLSIINSIPYYFKDYCKNSSLHGIRYLGEKGRTTTERIWWVIAFFLSACCCAYLITRTWNKWEKSPVILSLEQEQTPLWKIPFPAITICPTVKIYKDKYNYSSKFKRQENLTDEEYKQFWDVSLACHLEMYDQKVNASGKTNFTDDKAIANIISATRNIEMTLYDIRWQNRRVPRKFFGQQLTEDGVCFTFNSLSQADMYNDIINDSNNTYIQHHPQLNTNTSWNLEKGYPKNSTIYSYPKRTWNDGYFSGLTFHLVTSIARIDYLCGYPITGFKIMLHNPAETPKPNEQYILTSVDCEHAIVVSPQLTTTSEELHSLHWSVRKCFMQKERSLQYFKFYTQNNCKTECFTNITKHHCGCVPFYIPRDNVTKICGFGKSTCVTELQNKVLLYEMERTEDIGLTDKEKIILSECNCLPSCTDLQYTAETSHGKSHLVAAYADLGVVPKREKKNIRFTQIGIFFKQKQFLALHRSELFSQADFFASIGGLLGLFMGFSFLSLLEIVYFMTVSWYCKYKNNKVETKCF